MLRTEFRVLVERCGCFQATRGKCHPKRCYPEIYKLAYPKGGMKTVSHLVPKNKKRGIYQ